MRFDFDEMYRTGWTPWDTGAPSTELGRRLSSGDIPLSGKALDLGCGRGTNTIYLAQWGFEAVGVDSSPRAIQLAQEVANLNRMGREVRFVLGDVTRVRNIGEPFDFLFDRDCYAAVRVSHLDAYLANLNEFSKPGSLFLCLCGNASESGGEWPPRVTERDIRNELGNLFDILDMNEIELGSLGTRPLGWSSLMRKK